MKKTFDRHVGRHLRKAKSVVRGHLAKPHQYFYEKWAWYRWWHEQDYHRHVHYAAMMAGVVMAVYFVMINTILTEITYK